MGRGHIALGSSMKEGRGGSKEQGGGGMLTLEDFVKALIFPKQVCFTRTRLFFLKCACRNGVVILAVALVHANTYTHTHAQTHTHTCTHTYTQTVGGDQIRELAARSARRQEF